MNRIGKLIPLTAFCILLSSTKAYGCVCIKPPAVQQAFQEAPLIFVGSTDESWFEKARNYFGRLMLSDRYVRFQVRETLKGAHRPELIVQTRFPGGDCGVAFESDTSYLVYAYKGPNGEFRTSICTRTNSANGSQEELHELRVLRGNLRQSSTKFRGRP